MPFVSVAIALVAAVLFGLGSVLQQGSARSTARRHEGSRWAWLPVLGIVGRLLRNRRWLLGWLVNEIGFVCHVLALHLGAIAVVQAVLVLQLLFALLMASGWHSLRPTPRDWVGAAAVCAGIVTLVLLRSDVRQVEPPRGAVLGYVGLAAVAVTVLVAAARLLRGRLTQTRAAVVAVAAGISFSTTAVLLVVLTASLAARGVPGLLDWPLLGILVTSVVGTLLVQDAFAGGSLPTAVTAMTITDPVCSALAGAVLFDAVPPAGLELSLGLPTSGLLVVLGVALLATSATLHDERVPRPPRQRRAVDQAEPTHGSARPEATGISEAWSASSAETVRSHG